MATSKKQSPEPVEPKETIEQTPKLTKPEPIIVNTKTMVDQTAAMMIQDLRSFMQSNEQILTFAMAKAVAMTMNVEDEKSQKSGRLALEAIDNMMTSLPRFASAMNDVANNIINEFANNLK